MGNYPVTRDCVLVGGGIPQQLMNSLEKGSSL